MKTKIGIKKGFLMLLTVALFVVMVKLGFWQLDRGHQKLSIEQKLEQRQKEPAMDLASWQDNINTSQTGIKVQFMVQASHQPILHQPPVPDLVFLDNQIYEGRVGYLVFQLIDVSKYTAYSVALLELGFVDGGPDRRVLPSVDYVKQPQFILGRLYRKQANPMSRGLMVEKMKTTQDQAALRIQNLSIKALQSRWNQTLFPYAIQPLSALITVNDDADIGHAISNQPNVNASKGTSNQFNAINNQLKVSKDLPHPWKPLSMGSKKHFGYAVQWFSMATVLFLLAVWFGYRLYQQSRLSV
ncbi:MULTISPECIES: SURF1 family protein [Vibrio]|uniref:SURF1 family protein n=1 Tax=Vibrio TaxID=662 RepID=UPI001EE326E2|nr:MULTISPECIES: SURF1 family protein [Vibrio]